MQEIELTQDKVALVDDEDYEMLMEHKWYAVCDIRARTCYAATSTGVRPYRTTLPMHRLIMEAPKGAQVDHINHDGLDNRRENLRLCTAQENSRNRTTIKGGRSRYKGVCWHNQKWYARIMAGWGRVEIGHFDNEDDAARAYNDAAVEHFGEFALLNMIED